MEKIPRKENANERKDREKSIRNEDHTHTQKKLIKK